MKKPKPHRKPGAAAKPGPVHPAGVVPGGPMALPGRTPPPVKKPAPKKPAPRKPVPVHHGAPPPGILHRGAAPPVKTKSKKKPRALGDVPCVAAAVAACLGIPVAEVLPSCPDEAYIGDVLEALGIQCRPVEPLDVPGLILGLALPEGGHAALSAGDGLMWSWGLLMPVYGDVEEAWAVA